MKVSMIVVLLRVLVLGPLLFIGVRCYAADTLTQADLDQGVLPQAGDSVILRDFSKVTPLNVLSKESVRGKWWLRSYSEIESGQEQVILMTKERDMAQPETCLVPQVTYPLALKGWYQVWIATYRGPFGGGVDVKLTGDDCFVHIDPQQVALHANGPKPRVGAIVEIQYKPAVDLSGQCIEFRQPYGTFDSFHWGFCEASLAYIRLVRLSDEQVLAFKADQTNDDRRTIAFDDDNFSRYWRWGGESKEKVLRIYEQFRYHDILFHGLCLGASTDLSIPTPYSDVRVNGGTRLGDKRIRTMYPDLLANGVDLLKVASARAHKYGIKILPTLRMSSYGTGKTYQSLSKYRIKRSVRLDFACPEVRDHYVNLIRYILQNYDVDGFILDFTRHAVHFNADEPNKYEHMNAFSAQLREMVDEVSAEKGRKLLLAASFSEGPYVSGFIKHYLKVDAKPEERLPYQGIDVEAWVKNEYYDILIPEGHNIDKYIDMTRGTKTTCFPRWEYRSTLDCNPLSNDAHDPTAAEDKKDRPIDRHNGPREFEAGWLQLVEKGADGLYLFNNETGWSTLRRMGHIGELRERVRAGLVHGLIEGPMIEFRE